MHNNLLETDTTLLFEGSVFLMIPSVKFHVTVYLQCVLYVNTKVPLQ
jgi:hypothetical protein